MNVNNMANSMGEGFTSREQALLHIIGEMSDFLGKVHETSVNFYQVLGSMPTVFKMSAEANKVAESIQLANEVHAKMHKMLREQLEQSSKLSDEVLQQTIKIAKEVAGSNPLVKAVVDEAEQMSNAINSALEAIDKARKQK